MKKPLGLWPITTPMQSIKDVGKLYSPPASCNHDRAATLFSAPLKLHHLFLSYRHIVDHLPAISIPYLKASLASFLLLYLLWLHVLVPSCMRNPIILHH